MSESGATAVCFTLLSWVLTGWVAFELWPELRAAKLRLCRIQMEQNDREMFEALEAPARQAEEFRWLPLLRAQQRHPARAEEKRPVDAACLGHGLLVDGMRSPPLNGSLPPFLRARSPAPGA